MLKRLKNVFKEENMITAYLYFYIHLVTELLCFWVLTKANKNNIAIYLIPFIYDMVAFVPQSLIGYYSDKHSRVNVGLIGIVLLLIGFILFGLNIPNEYISLVIVGLGNACIHVAGAEVTLKSAKGKLSHSAIFVGGGSFGVIIGKLIGKTFVSFWTIALLGITMIPFELFAEKYKNNVIEKEMFNYSSERINKGLVIFLAVVVVICRGYMGYAIPTSWNKTTIQNVLLYCFMGIGKALGGILSDIYGVKKISVISIIGALPFLLFGDNNMYISLIGVMLFSMTMAITLGLIVSVLKNTSGLAFGYTTIGLYIGTLPVFFFKISDAFSNAIVITILSIICISIMLSIIKKERKTCLSRDFHFGK